MKMRWWADKKTKRKTSLMEGQNGYAFRRSRTLTGTTSARVAVAADTRGQLKTDRLKLHELRAHQVKLLRALAAVAAIAAVFMYCMTTFISTPAIAFGQPGGQPQPGQYQQTIQLFMREQPLQQLGLFLQQGPLEAYMKQKHPDIRSVVVGRDWHGGNSRFTIFFRQPLLVWQTSGQTFYVDDQGIAFTYNHFDMPSVVVKDQSGISPELSGGAVASTRFISFLGRIVGAVNGYNKGRVVEVSIPASTRQIDLKLEGRNYIIKTHIDRDPLEQAEDIAYALAEFDAKKVTPEYIDVRVAHRAFYK